MVKERVVDEIRKIQANGLDKTATNGLKEP